MSSIDPQNQLFGGKDGSAAVHTRVRSVLIVGAGGAAGKLLAEQMVARGLRVHCTDTRPMDVAGAECHLITEAPGFLPALARLVRAEHIELIIPASSTVLSTISAGRAVLGNAADIVMPGPGPTATAQDRLLTAWGLWSRGVAVPDFGVPSDFAPANATHSMLQSPTILRSRWADSGQPSMLVDDPLAIDWAALGDELLVQEFVPGPTYKAVVYRPLDGKGRLTTVLEETILDDEDISASIIPASRVPEVERIAQAAVRALGLTGPVEVSLRERADGVPVVLDVRAGFGPHSHLVPELLDVVLRDHPQRKSAQPVRDRLNGLPGNRWSLQSDRALPMGAQL